MTDPPANPDAAAVSVHPHRHHPGPPNKLARNLVIGALIVMVAAANLGNAFLPVLLTEHPLWFIAMNPSNRSLALASGELSAWSFYLVGFLRLVAPDPLFFLLGRWYGDAAIRWMERKAPSYGELLRQLEQWFDKAQVPVVAIAPNNPVCLFAGAAGMGVVAFAVANVVGTITRLVLIRLFSDAFEGPLGSLRSFIGDYQLPLLVLSVGIVAVTMLRDRRGGRDGIADLANLPEDIEEIEGEIEAEEEARPAWVIGPGAFDQAGRLTVDIDGSAVHMSTHDVGLADHAEAWAGAFSIPAARAGVALEVPTVVDPTWLDGAERNVGLATSWWGGNPDLVVRQPDRGAAERTAGPQASGRAICFTGGVDSFYSLLLGDHQATHLLFVVGFDVDDQDQERADRCADVVREVAAASGLAAVIVTTDLRRHPRFDAISWEHTHGAALAAVGHLISDEIGTLVIPPSYAQHRLIPWGSRPDLDVRWSVPGRLTIVHGDNQVPRLERVLAIAADPLVHRYLRVCWQNTGPDLNCGRCEKCARTMAMLAASGYLDRCTTFATRDDLTGVIDALPDLPVEHRGMWEDLQGQALPATLLAAIDRLLERSPA